MADKQISQHKRMAMGDGVARPRKASKLEFARGGVVSKTGIPTSPITDSKRANGVPGMKKGGKC